MRRCLTLLLVSGAATSSTEAAGGDILQPEDDVLVAGAHGQLHAASLAAVDMDLVQGLNEAWSLGAPSNHLAEAGVLVHVLDGAGIAFRTACQKYTNSSSCQDGFLDTDDGLPPSGAEMWRLFRAGQNPSGLSCSLISRGYPGTYAPLNVAALVDAGLAQLPFLVLNASAVEAAGQLSCCYPTDGGTVGSTCGTEASPPDGHARAGLPSFLPSSMQPPNRAVAAQACMPGCNAERAFFAGDLETCLAAMEPSLCAGDLQACRTAMQPSQCVAHFTKNRSDDSERWCPAAYNEVILAAGVQRSEPLAVAIAADASDVAVSLALAVAGAARLSLLYYDRSATSGAPAFSVSSARNAPLHAAAPRSAAPSAAAPSPGSPMRGVV